MLDGRSISVTRVASSIAAGAVATLAAVLTLLPRSPGAAPAVPVELAPGQVASFTVEPRDGRARCVAVEQRGLDAVVEVADLEGRVVLRIDRPLDRDGTEYALLPEASEPYRVSVRPAAASAPAGEVGIRIEDLEPSGSRWRAERAETEAARAYARGDAEGRREALAAYRRALLHWQESGEQLRTALAVYSVGVLHRLLGEHPEALAAARRAEELFTALDEARWRASARNEIGLAQVALGELDGARASFEASLALLEDAPDPFRRAIARSNVCLTDLHLGELRRGIDCYRRAEPLYRAAGDPQSEAMARTNSGRAYDILGEPDRALSSYGEALAIQRASGDASGEALTLHNLAVLHAAQGELGRALALHGEAAEIYRTLDEKDSLALALTNTGNTYWMLGETSRARAFYQEALKLQREAGNRRGEALTLTNLARLHEQEEEPERARALFEEALALRREIGHRRGEGRSLYDLGRHRLEAGKTAAALDLLGQALAVAREVGDREGEARALAGIGEARARSGDLRAAEDTLGRALEGFRSIGGITGEAGVSASMARLARRRGDLAEARSRVAAALERIESQRSAIAAPDLRATFLARRREIYELEIALLMDLHRAAPGEGYDAAALAAAERSRARSLLDLLGEAGAGLDDGLDPELRRHRQRLLHRLAAAERARRRAATAGTEREIETTLADLDRLDAEIRDSHPAYAALVRPPVLGAGEIQGLLQPGGEPETVLLVYSLGAEQSFLWWVEAGSIDAHVLPAQAVIESAARRVVEGLSTLDPTSARAEARDAAALAGMILEPVAERLSNQRLAVVADGALHHVPFAALPHPAALGEPLIGRHTIVYLPSASTLAVQRELHAGRGRAPRRALVIADPVFRRDDPRVAEVLAAAPAQLTRSTDETEPASFTRLPASRREAETIATLAAPGEVLTVTGFAASRATLEGGDLASYRVVHFATHGVIDDRRPRLSGLVLSQLDREGRPVDGFLRLPDISRLPLAADLVVLSGCRTASGRQIRGEGLVGLTRAFFHAGARRVLASLWQIQDRATAELVERFYRSLWVDGLDPPAALRAAQLALAGERRWRDPYYWAGFVLQGDWRPEEQHNIEELR